MLINGGKVFMYKKLIFILTFIFTLYGCSSIKYSNGMVNINKVVTKNLVQDFIKLKRTNQSTLFSSDESKEEFEVVVKELKKRHSNWNWSKIMQSKIDYDMSQEEVLLAWGEPQRYESNNLWRYKNSRSNTTLVTFRDDKVVNMVKLKSLKDSSTPLNNSLN